VAELQDVLAIMAMYGLADFAPEGDLVIVVDHGVVGDNPSPDVNRAEGREDCPDTAPGKLLLPVDACLGA
jgi:hypothetical protein